jgi:hypothetical protein
VTAAETAPDDDEVDYLDALLSRQSAILTGVADALRGDPGPLASHSHHDLAERAAAVVAELDALRAVRMEPMTPTALDAACAAEDRACVDDPLLDATDGAHPAWWRGHDRAAEMLTAQRDAALADAARARAAYARDLDGLRAEVRRADDERAAWRERVEARDESAERLTAELSTAHGEIARLRAALAGAQEIIEGRTIAPTDAEIVAHWRAGGTWIVEGVIVLRVVEAVCAHRDQASWAAVTWLPLDRSRRPCAWPVVEVSHG